MTLPIWMSLSGWTALLGALTLVACALGRPRRAPLALNSGPSLWRIRLGVILLALGALGWSIPAVKTGMWSQYIPAPALALAVRADVQAPLVRGELERRLRDNTLPDWALTSAAAALTDDLGNDEIPWNGIRAMEALRRLGPGAIGPLEQALRTDDPQERMLAASLLREIDGYEPSDRMLETLVEGLASTARSWDDGAFTPVSLQRRAVQYLAGCGGRAAGALEQGLRAGDEQQRFGCAVAAGFGRQRELADLAAPILIDRLRDNGVAGDARLAAPALLGLGEAARPWLEAHDHAPDRQQRDTVRLILLTLDGPPATDAEAARRLRLNRITDARADPLAVSLDDLAWLW